jgi:hypothetical protein
LWVYTGNGDKSPDPIHNQRREHEQKTLAQLGQSTDTAKRVSYL